MKLRIALYAVALLWLNGYIARDLFLSGYTGQFQSMHGYWMALARHANGSWWRFWDAGTPLEFTYQPLIPALTAWISRLGGIPLEQAFQSVSGLFYCLAPVTLFVLAAVVTRAPGWAFAAAVFYSLASPAQWLLPEPNFVWRNLADAHRLYLVAVWDETPHMAALTMLPLAVLFAYRRWWVLCGLSMAVAVLANAFGATMLAMGLLALLLAYGWDRVVGIAAAGVAAYLAICPWLPPSLIGAIRQNANIRSESPWEMGSWTALGAVVLGVTLLQWALERGGASQWMRFCVHLAWLTASTPLLQQWLGRHYLPQPGRYKIEAAMALSLVIVFGGRAAVRLAPAGVRVGVALAALAFAAEQTVSHRRFEKQIVRTTDVSGSIEYRVAKWMAANVHGRVFAAGSIAQWLNTFSSVEQFAGGAYTTAYNPVLQMAYWETFTLPPEHARTAVLWWKAFGVQAAAVPGKASPEFWKAFANPGMFDGVLPVLWREDDTTIYRVPQRTASYAHGVRREALVRTAPRWTSDTGGLERYVAAIDAAGESAFRWTGSGAAQIEAEVRPGEVLSIQVTHHPGWRARVNGREAQVHKDGLGLMWVEAEPGRRSVTLEFAGSWEQWFCRWISMLTIGGIALWRGGGMFKRWREG